MALLLALEVVRNAAVLAFLDPRPDLAAAAAPGDPSVRIQLGMMQIGTAARLGKPVPPAVIGSIYAASATSPLAPEPFLVRGVQAQLAGDETSAMRAFLAARWRDGRSLPARYFLADSYFRLGDARRGLAEIAVLARLVPSGDEKLALYLAAYARDRANWPALRKLFAAEPALGGLTLAALAADPHNAATILALSSGQLRSAGALWFAPLMQSLLAAGAYDTAHRIWARVSGVDLSRAGPIVDPQFTNGSAPPPFNWALASSTIGVAEREPGKGLHLIAYGHDEGPLASQLLLLGPGVYRIGIDAPGYTPTAGSMVLTVTCQGSPAPLASWPLDVLARGDGSFAVPKACPAQMLAFRGIVSDMPQQREATIRAVRLMSGSSRG